MDEFEMKKNAGDDLTKKDIKVKELQSELNHYKQVKCSPLPPLIIVT